MSTRGTALAAAAGRGVVAGLAGVAVMTTAEKAEQALTSRPNSYVPARALLTMVGRSARDDDRPTAPRVWSATGIRGGEATLTHTVVRLAFDQTVENATGAGAPPATWPRSERILDISHKALYSLVTGAVTDRLVAPTARSRRGSTSH